MNIKLNAEVANIGQFSTNRIILGDCLDIMSKITPKSIDMICCDLPYG